MSPQAMMAGSNQAPGFITSATTSFAVSWAVARWGSCYQARQISLNRLVALKMIRAGAGRRGRAEAIP